MHNAVISLLVLVVFGCSFNVVAKQDSQLSHLERFFSSDNKNEQKPLLIGYNDFPTVHQYHLPILKQVYKNLNIPVKFIKIHSNRSLVEVQNHRLDGDLARAKQVIDMHEGLIAVGPVFDRAKIILICQLQVPCNQNILNDPSQIVMAPSIVKYFRKTSKISAELYERPMTPEFVSLFNSKKYDYAFFFLTQSNKYAHRFQDAVLYPLQNVEAFHVLHEKHAHLSDQITQEMRKVLNAFSAKSNQVSNNP